MLHIALFGIQLLSGFSNMHKAIHFIILASVLPSCTVRYMTSSYNCNATAYITYASTASQSFEHFTFPSFKARTQMFISYLQNTKECMRDDKNHGRHETSTELYIKTVVEGKNK